MDLKKSLSRKDTAPTTITREQTWSIKSGDTADEVLLFSDF
jgi:hypothetical protein